MSSHDPLAVALLVATALERTGVAYLIGGSVASSLHGMARSSQDIDFAVDLREKDVPRLVSELGGDFDVDEEALASAARMRGSWNIFHVPTMTKIDLFMRRVDSFEDSEFARRVRFAPRPGVELWLKSAEDIVLRKLLWYRAGGEVSQRQWADVVEVLQVQAGRLDDGYLSDWASRLGIGDLLFRARADAAPRS